MNGGHDLGGMHGFGPINAEPQETEPVFHANWERRVFGLVRATGALGQWNADMARHARERQNPVTYLEHSYYKNWLVGLEKLLVETGLITAQELTSGKADGFADKEILRSVLKEKDVPTTLHQGSPATVPVIEGPRFQSGDWVRSRNRHPTGHTREPRYVRGRIGVIHEHHGAHIFPDLSAAEETISPGSRVHLGRHLYTVCFTACELWGENANSNSIVYVDLWEDYLEAV